MPPAQQQQKNTLIAWWAATPLYLQILIACVIGAVVGVALREINVVVQPWTEDFAQRLEEQPPDQPIRWPWYTYVKPLAWASWLAVPGRVVLQLLTALAAPLVPVAVLQALMHAQIPAGNARRLIGLLLLNTTVAILIGLFVANVVQPGKRTSLRLTDEAPAELKADPLQQLLENVPRSLVGPFTDNGKITSVIIIAVAVGIALRRLSADRFQTTASLI